MSSPSAFGDVIARPHPPLDQNAESGKRFQFDAYQEAIELLLKSGRTVIHSVPAGAGSGKTRLLVAILNGLLRCGVPPDQIEAISFTNASANDFRSKHIRAAGNGPTANQVELPNICFSTIHQCAMNVLRKLQPHLSGVAYYFEDAKTGSRDDDDEQRRRAVRLALYATVVYGHGDETLLNTLAGYAEGDDRTFILQDLGSGNHLEQAQKLIREDLVSDAGLGAFTNTAEGGPDYCIAVATDALMRLFKAQVTTQEKRQIYGVPAYMAVDEAQDLDFLQLLFLRALALNGVSIILVGDSRQTLYEFRQSLSDYPFSERFLKDFVDEPRTGIHASISRHALSTNYRCRQEIVEAAEEVSRIAVDYSSERNRKEPTSPYLRKIEDPKHIARGQPYITPDNRTEKLAAAISVIVGEPMRLDETRPLEAGRSPAGALGLLPEFSASSKSADRKQRAKRPRAAQILGLSGGENSELIRQHLGMLYERAKAGETAAIITRNGIRDVDDRHLKQLITQVHPGAKSDLQLNLISPPKHAALGEHWFPDTQGKAKHELPFSSVLIAGAMSYVLSSDRETQQRLKIAGRREISTIYVRPNGIRELEQREEHIKTIAEELTLFFGGLASKASDLFPEADSQLLAAGLDHLKMITARFTFDVLVQYGRLLWKFQPRPAQHPCRFHHMACEYLKGRHEGLAIRELHVTKRYLKLMWRALSSTTFGLSETDRLALRAADLTPEAMDADTCLGNFAQSLNDYCLTSRGPAASEVAQRRGMFIRDRETIYDEFSQLWHIKTRTYMREVARGLGRHVRMNPASSEEAYRSAVWKEEYSNARFKSRITITYKPDKGEYGGLFVDLANGMKHDAVLQRRGGKAKAPPGKVSIDITTVHSSKGLEWDHVMFFFPQPSPNDKDSSFKSCRDLVYVAMTRAARTLTVVLQKRKRSAETASDTGIKVFVELMHRWADDNEYYNRPLDWGAIQTRSVEDAVKVYDETSHSELERSQTCRMHHYYQDMRQVATMVPLTPPSYAFFFHGSMSTICAAFIKQRLPSRADPSIAIAHAVERIVATNQNESDAYRYLSAEAREQILTLMESMIPMYFLGDRTRHHALLRYYADSITRHLAAIASASRLFKLLDEHRDKPEYRILIEKSVRRVLPAGMSGELLPIVGIPDIKILGPDLTYIADYKTVPRCDDEGNGDALAAYEQMLSTKTKQQVNYYQGMIQAGAGHRYLAELLYVTDATLMEHEDPPPVCDKLPHINQGANYKVVVGVEHAQILYTDRFDKAQFDETVNQIRSLRTAYQDSTFRPEDMFQPVPLVGGGRGEVTRDECMHCGSGLHCAFNKFLNVGEE